MDKKTLKFSIRQDGTVTEEVVVEKQQVKEEETLLQKITPFKRTK